MPAEKKKSKQITVVRKNALNGGLATMHIVFDDTISVKLNNGESKTITITQDKTECEIQVKDHVFRVVDIQHVNKIILQYAMVGIKCSIVYQDGHRVDALNKNPGASVSNTIWIILLILFVLMPILANTTSLISMFFVG